MKYPEIFKQAFKRGLKKGLKSSLELLLIMVPISFGLMVLEWTGWLGVISGWIAPVFKYFGLQGACAFAYITGALTSCYAAIAVMVTLDLSIREITILSLMVLTFHNIVVELSVQKKAGSSAMFIFLLRFITSILFGLILNLLLPKDAGAVHIAGSAAGNNLPFMEMLSSWMLGSLKLIFKILAIVVALMIVHDIFEQSGAMKYLTRIFTPIVRIFGLSDNSVFIWIVANLLGLAYGAGIILNERKENRISDKDIREVNVSLALCHSTFEDTILFAAIGALVPWILIPRFLAAIIAVWCYKLYNLSMQNRA